MVPAGIETVDLHYATIITNEIILRYIVVLLRNMLGMSATFQKELTVPALDG